MLVSVFATSCSETQRRDSRPGTSASRWNRIALPDAGTEDAFDAAIAATRQYFPSFDASRADLRIETSWAEYTQRGGTDRIRDNAFKTSNRMRRKATVMITSSGSGSIALCEVHVQRLDTADQRAFQQHREFNDVPNSTPIERDAAVSGSQSESWTDVARDSTLERNILQGIFNRVNQPDGSTTRPANGA